MKPIDVAGFDAKFAADPDPWSTWTNGDEALKRTAILHALGRGPLGRVLELGAGNGSNSRPIARRALRLDATEATTRGTELVRHAVHDRYPRARAATLIVPARPPRATYDAIVIAELLYYLDRRTMRSLARQCVRLLAPGGTLVLAHHRRTFYDFAQRADGIQRRFLDATAPRRWRVRTVRMTQRWTVITCHRR